jgi:hypothetical protein
MTGSGFRSHPWAQVSLFQRLWRGIPEVSMMMYSGFFGKPAVLLSLVTENTKAVPALLHLNVFGLDEIAPPVSFGLNVDVEICRRSGGNRQTFNFFKFLERLRLNGFPD